MNAPSIDIKDILENGSVATFATDLFIGQMPMSPDACIALIDTAGFKPESWYIWDRPGLQVLARAAEGAYSSCYNKIVSVRSSLHGLTNETINSTIYKCVVAAHEPIYVGEDEKNRPMFSLNFEIQRTPA